MAIGGFHHDPGHQLGAARPRGRAHVLVVGGGVAGLVATRELSRLGLSVTLLEARHRLGGRVWTLPAVPGELPTELGAELIHGRPSEIFSVVHDRGLHAYELNAPRLLSLGGAIQDVEDFELPVGEVLHRISLHGPDEALAGFLRRSGVHGERLRRTRAFVEGFHAAPTDDVSAHDLHRVQEAEEELHGERPYVLQRGFASLVTAIAGDIDPEHARVCLGHIVEELRWRPGQVRARVAVEDQIVELEGDVALLTLPAGVLKSNGVHFNPPLTSKRDALEAIGIGHVLRLTVHLAGAIWRNAPDRRLRGDWGFLFSDDPDLPTLWRRGETLVAWAGGSAAARLPRDPRTLRRVLVHAVSRQLHLPRAFVDSAILRFEFHDWDADPFARGAYSYHRVGGEGASRALAHPLAHTLFFAGEASDLTYHHGTVHGAMASGARAAAAKIAAAAMTRAPTRPT